MRYNFNNGGGSYGSQQTTNDDSGSSSAGGYHDHDTAPVVDDHEHHYADTEQHDHHNYAEKAPVEENPHAHVESLPDKEPSHNFDDYLPADDSVKSYTPEPDADSSHGFKLHVTGEGLKEGQTDVNPMIAAAAVNPHEAVIQVNGDSILAPFHEIDPKKVELACNKDGNCALIPNDGDPSNDLMVSDAPA